MPQIDIEAIVDKLESYNLIRTNKVSGDWYSVYCPFHNNGQERRPSCGVLIRDQYRNGQMYKKGMFHCFTCGAAYNLQDGISKILESKNISRSGLDWLKENVPGFEESEFEYLIPESLMEETSSKFAIDYISSKIDTTPYEYVSEKELEKYRVTVKYMYDRGLTDEIIEKYDIGVDLEFVPKGLKRKVPCITFPVRDKFGRTLFVARRSIEGKYFYLPRDITKPLYGVYELPKGCKSVDIVESVFNMTSVVKYGRPCVCLLGTGNPYQIQQLKELGVNEFRIGLDPDAAGEKGTRRLKEALKDVAVVWTYQGIPEGKDMNDLTEEQFKSLTLV